MLPDLLTVAFREFSDTIKSRRFILLVVVFGLIMVASMAALMSEQTSYLGAMPTGFLGRVARGMTASIGYLAPIIGIALGCDAISGEREGGSLKLLLAQPIYRDAVINGKFLAATLATTLAIFIPSLATVGGAMLYLGVSPTPDELARLAVYLVFSVLFAMTFYAIATLLSTVSKKTSQSVMLSVGVWVALTVIIPLIAESVAGIFVARPSLPMPKNQTSGPVTQTFGPMNPAEMEQMRKFTNMVESVSSITPNYHFDKIGLYIFGGFSGVGLLGTMTTIGSVESLPLLESLGQCWPNIVVLVLFTLFAFAASYMIFTRQEIR